MKRAYVLRRSGRKNVFQLDMARPYEALYCSIFGEGGAIEFFCSEYENMQNALDEIMDTLTEREVKVLLYRFGYLGEFYSLRDAGHKLGCSGELVRLVERKALRKMRHPSRSRRLRSKFPEHGIYFEKAEGAIDYKQIIFKELDKYIRGDKYRFDFLDKIMEKNNISVSCPISANYEMISIDDLELSVRAYNCLKRAGINTLGDLLSKSAEDMMNVRNMGRKCLEELIRLIKEMNIEWTAFDELPKLVLSKEKFTTIHFIRNKECTKYKVNCKNNDELTECIYEMMLQECTKWAPIIDYNLSTGLLNLLLLKGYFFVESIINEYEQIIKDFKLSGYDAYVEELEDFAFCMKKYIKDVTHSTTKIIWLPTDVAKKIMAKRPKTYNDLYECFEAKDEETKEKYIGMLYNHLLYSEVNVEIMPLENQQERYAKYFEETVEWDDLLNNIQSDEIADEETEDLSEYDWEL